MDLDFAHEARRAADALQQRSRVVALAAIAGGVVLGGASIASLHMPYVLVLGVLAVGAGVSQLTRRGLSIAEVRAAADHQPDWWFVGDASGLVFFNARGAFAEKHGGFHPYDTNTVRLKSVAYVEEKHALLLQVSRLRRTRDGQQEAVDRHTVPLPSSISPELALKEAVAANRRAAAA